MGSRVKRQSDSGQDDPEPRRWSDFFSRSSRGANVVYVKGEAESGTGMILTRWGALDYGSAMPRTARVAPCGMVFHV